MFSVHRYYESRKRLFNDSQPARPLRLKQVQNETHKRLMHKKVFLNVVYTFCNGVYCVLQLYTDKLKVVKCAKE